ncbi:M10 family metallopeptidase C-terminal domain-containing protein [Paracoccus contaminans]|uniref:Hemolysin n=1 Tax=Paracoccus contaminans TaxID=1945662 RepID=A0A1W6CWR9_9RHOB|nr:M10 family metallopeptidase C-terminal domain-containing protein [Paracoccus contaminans]ARJ69300.1 hemolysin [Paracoccus contaminans]
MTNQNDPWWVNDQTPDNPFGKSDDYEGYLRYLGALNRSLTPAIAAGTLRINVTELNDHPDYKAAAIGALQTWATVTPLKFEIVDDAAYDRNKDWIRVVSPEIGEPSDGSAYSSNRYVSIGQRFHDSEPNLTDVGGYVFDSFIHEFGHEFGLNHPGLYNYSGPGGVQISYINNATWIYDRQQYSVMSYFDGIDVGETSRWSATTALMADVETVIRRFFSTVDAAGNRTYQTIELNTGDDTYGFGGTHLGQRLTATGMTHDVGFLIHDTGGNDTIDFSGSTAGTILDMRAGHFSSVNGHSNNVSIFAGHNADQAAYYIENAVGSDHADVIIGNDGANRIDGRGGADSMAGGAGDDVYFVDSADDVVRERGRGGNDTIYVMTDGVRLGRIANVEHIVYVGGSPQPGSADGGTESGSSPVGEILAGTAAGDSLDGGDGSQTIFGLDGDDLIVGGRDSLDSRDINNTIPIADLDDQTESNDAADALYGGAGNDTIMGGAGEDTLDGGAGDDVLRGQAGADVFRGGAGIDTVDYSMESPFQLLVNLETNVASGGTGTGDTFYGIENLIGSDDRIDRFVGNEAGNHFWGRGGGDYFNGRAGDDILDGGADGDILYGEGGNDTIIGGSGQDYLDGGAGTDTVVYEGSSAGVTVDLAAGTASGGDADGPVQIVGRGMVIRHDILRGFENAVGSMHDDRLIGDGRANLLSGGAGNDTLTGGLGPDTLAGGAGRDTADYSDRAGGVRLDLSHAGSGGDAYVSIENLSGSGFGDRIHGDDGANLLTGQGGADTLIGAAGDDTLLGDFDQTAVVTRPGMGSGYVTLGADATNGSIATALDLSNNFTTAADPDIFDSTTVLHTTVNAVGTGQGGYYRLDVAAGTVITLDIDHIADPDVHDSWLRVLDAAGNVIAENDDGGSDPGSSSGRDSGLVFTAPASGTYYILEGRWDPEGAGDGWSASVPAGSSYELNVSVEFPPAPAQPGEAGADRLVGGDGNDLLDGGVGADTLIGGAGDDFFRFATALGEGNVDRIMDFDAGSDMCLLDGSIFATLAEGDLAVGAFQANRGGLAIDADDRIIFDTDDRMLAYDADGAGGAAAIVFAQISGTRLISADDFHII